MNARRKKEMENREEGKGRAKMIILALPDRIREAAEQGETSVYESYENGDEWGGYMFGFIESWAEEQGFKTKLRHNIDPMNEGGNSWNSLTIIWE